MLPVTVRRIDAAAVVRYHSRWILALAGTTQWQRTTLLQYEWRTADIWYAPWSCALTPCGVAEQLLPITHPTQRHASLVMSGVCSACYTGHGQSKSADMWYRTTCTSLGSLLSLLRYSLRIWCVLKTDPAHTMEDAVPEKHTTIEQLRHLTTDYLTTSSRSKWYVAVLVCVMYSKWNNLLAQP